MADHLDSSAPQEPISQPPKQNWAWLQDRVLFMTLPAVLALDQLTKFLVRSNLTIGQSWPSEGLARITYGTNTGLAFGFFPNATLLLIIFSVGAIGFLIYFYRTHALSRPILRFAIGLLLGGALGNLIDRLALGSVVDFVDIGPWPIFNVADSSIVIGMIILVSVLFLMDDGKSAKGEKEVGPSGGSADSLEP